MADERWRRWPTGVGSRDGSHGMVANIGRRRETTGPGSRREGPGDELHMTGPRRGGCQSRSVACLELRLCRALRAY
ncbi:hypothetical protein VFPBJ_00524 [Purpureocillium lilacinum]|uniref:Uncharacterized protein n=1 Tax=Purpureocillium lilacinum TaxID=33203 RepID=A0A179H8J5_PURLI|nr:hypothetical protein VFPBJ_00524 [Purpureocillium lilacinum]